MRELVAIFAVWVLGCAGAVALYVWAAWEYVG